MKILNMQTIEGILRLEAKTRRSMLHELLDLYIESTPEILQKVKVLRAAKAYEDLAREAHSLKASSGNLGAEQMADLCMRIESLLVEDENFSEADLDLLLQNIDSVGQQTLVEIKKIKTAR